MLSNPLKLSSFDDPAVEVAEDEADKEALERQEGSFNYVEDLRNDTNQNQFFSLIVAGKTCIAWKLSVKTKVGLTREVSSWPRPSTNMSVTKSWWKR